MLRPNTSRSNFENPAKQGTSGSFVNNEENHAIKFSQKFQTFEQNSREGSGEKETTRLIDKVRRDKEIRSIVGVKQHKGQVRQVAKFPKSSISKNQRNRKSEVEGGNTVQTVSTRDHLTPGMLGSFNQKSDVTVKTPGIEEDQIRNPSQPAVLNTRERPNWNESPMTKLQSARSPDRSEEKDSDQADSDEMDEEYEEECKGKFSVLTVQTLFHRQRRSPACSSATTASNI